MQRDFADISWRWNKRSASSLDGALRKGKRAGLELCEFAGWRAMQYAIAGGEGVLRFAGEFAHAHYQFRKRALLVPFRCDLIARIWQSTIAKIMLSTNHSPFLEAAAVSED